MQSVAVAFAWAPSSRPGSRNQRSQALIHLQIVPAALRHEVLQVQQLVIDPLLKLEQLANYGLLCFQQPVVQTGDRPKQSLLEKGEHLALANKVFRNGHLVRSDDGGRSCEAAAPSTRALARMGYGACRLLSVVRAPVQLQQWMHPNKPGKEADPRPPRSNAWTGSAADTPSILPMPGSGARYRKPGAGRGFR